MPPDPDGRPSDVVADSTEDGETAETKKELIEGGVESEAVVEVGDTVIYFEIGRPDSAVSVTIVSGPSNPNAGIIDKDTPVARALLGLAEGEPGDLITPAGAKQIKVISIDKSPFPSSPEPEGRTRQVLTDNIGFANAESQTFRPEDPVQPYENWQSRRLPDPKLATPAEVLRGILDIVKAEGPIMVIRVYQLYAKSAGISRVGKAVRLALNQALTVAVRQGMIVVDDELSSRDRLSSVARLPDTPPIVPRTLGDRSLDQVPPSEIAHVMRSIQTQESRINREALYREVLNHYGLRRMTQHVFEQLSRVCSELLSEDETSQLAGPAFDTSEGGSGAGPLPEMSPSVAKTYRITLLGESFSAASLGDTLITVLGRLADMNSEFLPRLSLKHGRTRQHVAQRPEDIYPGRPDLADRYSREIRPGWYVGDNYARRDVERILRDACEIAGITYGEDLVLEWPGEVEQA